MAPLSLGCSFPNFQAKASGLDAASSVGGDSKSFDLYHYMGDGSWTILFSHPADFTPVCTTELARAVELHVEFDKRNCKIAALSCNGVESHQSWSADIMSYCNKKGKALPFPIIADESRELAKMLNIMDPDEVNDMTKLPLSCRAVFFINTKKQLRAQILYPATTGRSFEEILRVLDSLQLTEKHPVATPEGWTAGKECMVVPTLNDEKAQKDLPKGFKRIDVPSEKSYIRMTPDPINAAY